MPPGPTDVPAIGSPCGHRIDGTSRNRPATVRGMNAANGKVVVAEGVSRRYGEGEAAVDALIDVSTGFERGRFTAIMGPSGSGKSTLMHILAGLDRPTAGSVLLDGEEISGLDDAELTRLRRDKLGFVFQFFNLLPVLTAEENLVLPLSIAGRRPDRDWLERLIATVGLGDRRTHRPSELSGGQQQRVAVARALVSKPAVVFADEPTGNLDSKSSGDVLRLLRQAVDEFGQTVIMVSHDPAAAAHADRLLTLRDGRIVHDDVPGSADQVIELMKQID
jgi:putative ABC transport system ATP-binding protein